MVVSVLLLAAEFLLVLNHLCFQKKIVILRFLKLEKKLILSIFLVVETEGVLKTSFDLGLFFLIFFQTLFSSEDEKDDSLDEDDKDESFNNEEREILDFCFFGFDFSLFLELN